MGMRGEGKETYAIVECDNNDTFPLFHLAGLDEACRIIHAVLVLRA